MTLEICSCCGKPKRPKEGDSRRLSEVVGAAGLVPLQGPARLVVSSPPFQNQFASHDNFIAPHDTTKLMDTGFDAYGSTPGQLATLPPGTPPTAIVSSPPFAGNSGGRGEASRNGIDAALFDRHSGGMIGGMGDEPGNLGNLPMGQLPTAAIISSPPYASARPESNGGGVDLTKQWETYRASGGGQSLEAFTATQLKHSQGYGSAPGQLSKMKLGDISAVISSPPYAESVNQSVGANDTEARIERMKRAGIDVTNRANVGGPNGVVRQDQTYGSAPGQLGAMSPGDIQAVIGSPPYADGCTHTGGNDPHPEHIQGSKRGAYGVTVIASPPFADSVGSDDPDKRGGLFRDEKRRNDVNLTGTYGETEGQLGGMKAGEVSAVVGSPPFENSTPVQDVEFYKKQAAERGRNPDSVRINGGFEYGSTDGQIGALRRGSGQATQGETFWTAAALIVSQCALLLPVGGVAIWVVKNYIKSGREVDFTGQWQQLCEACGFETVHVHRAMLVKDNGEQATMASGHDTTGTTTNLLGEEKTTAGQPMLNKKNIVAKKSFFRRLAEKNGSPPIDFETVLCTRKK